MGKGPKTKLTPALIEKICEAVRKGNYPTTAAAALGIPSSTLSIWRTRGAKETRGIYFEFHKAVTIAEGESEQTLVDIVIAGARINPKYALQYLTRRWADRYGRRDNLEVSGPEGAPVEIQVVKERLLARLEALKPKGDA